MIAAYLLQAAAPFAPAAPVSDTAIRRVVEAVFRAPEFNRTSLLSRIFAWIAEWLGAIARFLLGRGERGVLYWVALAVLAGALALILWHVGYALYVRDRSARMLPRWGTPAATAGDPWTEAQRLAERGDYTAAAHALYAALLQAAARRDQIRLHPSKTVGDYVRDLRRGSSALFSRFREFARAYETVIYGVGRCDRERFERLRALASPVVQPDG